MRLSIEKELKQLRPKKKSIICRNCGKPHSDRRSKFCSKWCKKDYYRTKNAGVA